MNKPLAIGIDLGGTHLRIGLVSEKGEVVKKIKVPTPQDLSGAMLRSIEELFSEEIAGIGIGVAGIIDRKKMRVSTSPNLSAVEKIDLVNEIKARFPVPVCMENDANAAAKGELWAGAGRDFSAFVLFTLGTGIGGGIVHDRKLLSVSAEIGHMSINAEGEKCHCGNYGCLESYAGARAILAQTVSLLEAGRESLLREYCSGNFYKLTTEDIYRAAREGDNLSRDLLKNAGKYLGIGIANIINIFNPEAVILAGGLTGAWDIYVQEAIREASKRALRELFEGVKIVASSFADDAGIIGSAGMVFQEKVQ